MLEKDEGLQVVCRLVVRDPDAGDIPTCTIADFDNDRRERSNNSGNINPFELSLLDTEPLSISTVPNSKEILDDKDYIKSIRQYDIRSVSGIVFDYETRATYFLRITCRDRTNRTFTRDLKVFVQKVNEAPVFTKETYTAEVFEDYSAVETALKGTTANASALALIELSSE